MSYAQVDLAFSESILANAAHVVLGSPLGCAVGGHGVLIRKDKRREFAWFEEGALRYTSSEAYRDLCRLTDTVHGERCLFGISNIHHAKMPFFFQLEKTTHSNSVHVQNIVLRSI